MKFGELRRLLNTVPIGADDDPVVFRDADNGEVFDVKDVEYEGMSYDEGGNATSVGGTVWLKGEPY